MKESYSYDDLTDTLTVKKTYDAEPVIKQNAEERAGINKKAIQKYKGDFVKCASLDQGDVERLYRMGYNILSPDQDEVRRALVYLQSNEPHLMTVHGKPFSRQKVKWV